MTAKTLARTDAAAATLLLLWAGMVCGFAFLTAPALFRLLPSRDLAGTVVARIVPQLDLAAWAAFGGALLLVQVPRWHIGLREAEAVGPLRLWGAAALVALLMGFTSEFIVTPRLHAIRERMGAPVETLPPAHPDRAAYRKAHGVSRQLMALRLLLALGLAAGAAGLPRRKPD